MKTKIILTLCGANILLVASASAVTLVNSSFETQSWSQWGVGSPNDSAVTGWRLANTAATQYQLSGNVGSITGADGILYAQLFYNGSVETLASVRPTVTVGDTYTMSFAAGSLYAANPNEPLKASIIWYGDNSTYTAVSTSTQNFNLSSTLTGTGASASMLSYSFSAVAPVGATHVGVKLMYNNWGGVPTRGAGVDNITLIPEPSSLVLFGMSGLALLHRRRRTA